MCKKGNQRTKVAKFPGQGEDQYDYGIVQVSEVGSEQKGMITIIRN
jgi:hypothetical protein